MAAPRGRTGEASAQALAQGLGWFSIGLGTRRAARAAEHRPLSRHAPAGGPDPAVRHARDHDGPRDPLAAGPDALDLGPGRRRRESISQRSRPACAPTIHVERNVIVATAAVACVTALDAVCAERLSSLHQARASARRRLRARDYSKRRGMPRAPEAMRGAASDFDLPKDMRIPEAMRPYPTRNPPSADGTVATDPDYRSLTAELAMRV